MKITCPVDPSHDRFVVTVPIYTDVVVNSAGRTESVQAIRASEVITPGPIDGQYFCYHCLAKTRAVAVHTGED